MNSRCFAGRVAMAGLLLGCESEVSLGTPGAAGEGGASPAIENDLPIEGAGGGATQGVGGSGGAAPFDVFLPGSPATWEPASETPIFCDRHTATRVDEGSVLIVGSCWLGREELPRAALVYDIEARTFTPIGMAEPRALHVAVVLDDGRVAIAGDANHVEYFTAGGGFELGPALATVRREPGIVRLPSNRFWLIGGRDEDGAALATTEIVDGDSASSSTGPELLTPRVRPAVLRNGPCAAWVMGGEEMTLGATVAATTEAAACPACPFASGLDLPEGNWPVLAMGDWLLKSGHRSEEQMKDLEQMVFSSEWNLPYGSHLGMLAYAMVQEHATFINYRNLRQRASELGGDPALQKLLSYVGVDESSHYGFFRDCLAQFLKYDRDTVVEQLRTVLNNFRMPAIHDLLDASERRIARIRELDIFSETIYYGEVYLPVLRSLGIDRSEMREGRKARKSAQP